MALKTIRTTYVVEANKETENGVYNVTYQYEDFGGSKNLSHVHVEIMEKQGEPEEGQSLINIGNMDYNSGQISMNGFPYSEKTTMFMTDFSDIIEEIKAIVK